MSQFLNCAKCGKHMAELRDARVRDGMVVYCSQCNKVIAATIERLERVNKDVPDFLKGFMR